MHPGFTSTDAWILAALALAHGKDGAGREGIISSADYLNHAIPTAEELKTALAKFEAAGILQKNGDLFLLIGKGADFLQTLAKLQHHKWMAKAEELLRKL